MERITHTTYKYKTVSLFAGIGGFDLAFSNAGFDMVWSNDIDKYACQTFRANIRTDIVEGDITEHLDEIPPHDILVGGFPCQPFSSIGKRQGFEDEKGRGALFFIIKSIILKHHPKAVVLENVKNLVTHDKGKTFQRIKDELEECGYAVNYQVLNTADFGIPQRRKRVFIVALRKDAFKDTQFAFPQPQTQPLQLTAQDLLDEDVPAKYFVSKVLIKALMSEGTKNFKAEPTIDNKICNTLVATMHKMHRASQDNYYTDNVNYERYCDETKTNIRRLTPNEARKLQGFPSDWQQVVSDTQAYKQFGNAVTVDVVYAVAKELMQFLDENLI
jgi:DNA (cytosine-5)-methyltransferase 1